MKMEGASSALPFYPFQNGKEGNAETRNA